MTERLYFRREYASRYYGWMPFAFTSVLVEIPYILVFSAAFMCGFYWTAGLVNTPAAGGYFYLMMVFFVCWAVTLGFVIASVAETTTAAAVLNPLVVSMLVLFSGLMQTASAMPRFWSAWMYWLDPFHYYIEGLAVNELETLPVECKDFDFLQLNPPPGETCGSYFENFFASGGSGYLDNPNATEACRYCPYKSAEQFYSTTFGWDAAHKWRNLGIIIGFFAFNTIVFMILCYWKRKARR